MKSILTDLLNERAKNFYLSDRGFMQQGKEARGSRINGSIGVALTDQGSPAVLPVMADQLPGQTDDILYSSCYGEEALRLAWKGYQKEKNPGLSPILYSTPLVTSGITHGMNLVGNLFFEPGDDLIVSSPVYDNYLHSFQGFFGVNLLPFPLLTKGKFNLKDLERSMASQGDQCRILLNFPNNPLGYSLTREEARDLKVLLKKQASLGKKILLILDDAYFGLFFEKDCLRESLFSYLTETHENLLLVKMDGASKEFYSWGLRLGFLSFYNSTFSEQDYQLLENRAAAVVRATVSNVSRLNQTMLLRALGNPHTRAQQEEQQKILKKRYRRMKDLLEEHREYEEYFRAESFNSGYFFSLKLKEGIDAHRLRKILRTKSIGLISPTERHLRIAFSSLKVEDMHGLLQEIFRSCKEIIQAL